MPQDLFVEPEGIKAHNIVDTEVFVWIVTLDVIEPAVVNLLPRDRQQRRILFKDRFSLANQVLALGLVEFTIDVRQDLFEVFIAPFRVVLWAILAVPGAEVIRGVHQGRHNGADRNIKFASLCLFKPYRYLNGAEIRLNTDILEHFLDCRSPSLERRSIADQKVYSFDPIGMTSSSEQLFRLLDGGFGVRLITQPLGQLGRGSSPVRERIDKTTNQHGSDLSHHFYQCGTIKRQVHSAADSRIIKRLLRVVDPHGLDHALVVIGTSHALGLLDLL